jgi:bifunctional DNase/RNase
MVEVTIDSIRVSLMNQHRVVVLKETDSDRYLPIWIGPFEADAITIQLQGVQVPRPLTHDLLKSFIRELGVKVSHVLVSELRNDTFFAQIVVDVDGNSMEIDSRPSDAIALAVRVGAPIFVSEQGKSLARPRE